MAFRASSTIEFSGISKRFGGVVAVNDLTFTVEPGVVTGFLGPNGAGKTTTLRMLLGLVRPTSGSATFGGSAYHELAQPLSTVGTALEASSFHPGRSGRNHLRVYAAAAGIDDGRVANVLETVGLSEFADRKVGGYSMGMRQRLGLAFALLGDPECSFSTNRATGSTRRASVGCAVSFGAWPRMAERCLSRHTF